MAAVDDLVLRLERQLEALPLILDGVPADLLRLRPAREEWSAGEHLAHLARHQAVFLERTRGLLATREASLGRYLAERDPEWPAWAGLPLDEVLHRLRAGRADLLGLIRSLSPEEARTTGVHPGLGEVDVVRWLNFFALHEAHHLYSALVTLARVRNRPAAGG